MTTKYTIGKEHTGMQLSCRQKGFFDLGLGLGLFLLFGGTAAVITANEEKESTTEVAVMQELKQTSQNQHYVFYDTDC